MASCAAWAAASIAACHHLLQGRRLAVFGFPLGPQRGQRVAGLLGGHGRQREAHVHQDPFAGTGRLVEQADVDRAGHATHVDQDQVGMTGITRHELSRDSQAHTYPLSADSMGADSMGADSMGADSIESAPWAGSGS